MATRAATVSENDTEVLVKDIPENVSQENLELFMEALIPNSGVSNVEFLDVTKTKALVTFDEPITDWQQFLDNGKSKQLGGKNVSLQKPHPHNTIFVSQLPVSVTQDDVELYFEAPRSGGGDVTQVWMLPNQSAAVVQFEEISVVRAVLNKEHIIRNHPVEVAIYDRNRKLYPPVDVSLDLNEPHGSIYHASLPQPDSGTEETLTSSHGSTSLPQNYREEWRLAPFPSKPDPPDQDVEHLGGSETALNISHAWPSLPRSTVEETSPRTKSPSSVQAKSERFSAPPTKANSQTVDTTADAKKHTVTPREKFKEESSEIKIPSGKFPLLQRNWDRIKTWGPTVEVKKDEMAGVIYLTGPSNDHSMARMKILEFLQTAVEKSLYKKAYVLTLLMRPEGTRLLDSICGKTDQNTILEVQPNEGRILITSTDKNKADSVAKKFNDTFNKTAVKLEVNTKEAVKTREWETLKRDLETRKLVSVYVLGDQVSLFGERQDVKAASESIIKFLQKNKNDAAEIQLKQGIWRLLKDHHKLDIEEACRCDNQTVQYKFEKDDSKHKWWISFHGWGKGPVDAKELVNKKYVKKMHYHKIAISKPGLFPLMTKGHGRDWIKYVEMSTKCCIEVCCNDQTDLKGSKSRSSRKADDTPTSVYDRPHSARSSRPISPSANFGHIGMRVKKGDIVQQSGIDVLVNPVAGSTGLWKGGAIAHAFAVAGTRQLQELVNNAGGINVGQVTVTSTSGNIKARHIFHIRYGPWEGSSSEKMLRRIVSSCLEEAESRKVTSIAFPSIGCGALKYPLDAVAQCITGETKAFAGKYPKSCLQSVYIIVFEDSMYQHFLQHVTHVTSSQADDSDTSKQKTGLTGLFARIGSGLGLTKADTGDNDKSSVPTPPETVFHINTLGADKAGETQRALQDKLASHYHQTEVESQTLHSLSDRLRTTIRKLANHNVTLYLDEAAGKVFVSGEKGSVMEAEKKIRNMLDPEDGPDTDTLAHMRTTDPAKYMQELAKSLDKVPVYWTKVPRGRLDNAFITFKDNFYRENVSATVFKAVEAAVTKSWRADLVGHGRDAVGLRHSNIQVKQVERIENCGLYSNYVHAKKHMLQTLTKPAPAIGTLPGQGEVWSKMYNLSDLDNLVLPEVNETWLFHGSEKQNVEVIIKNGLEDRIGSKGLFGKGLYFAESSTKADQYADAKDSRTPGDHYMFLVRTLLGHPYVSQKGPYADDKPPCMTCKEAKCRHKNHVGFYNSVIGYKKDGGVDLNFREFILYDRTHCYPEFLITYVRK